MVSAMHPGEQGHGLQGSAIDKNTKVSTLLQISLNVPAGYEGVALVKGQEDKEECRKDIHGLESSTNLTVGFFVASKSCGVTRVKSVEPAGTNYTMILHLKHRVPLGDRWRSSVPLAVLHRKAFRRPGANCGSWRYEGVRNRNKINK
ncbi:hypothetical protein COOONC_24760 [Cooperia oncophora]